MKPSPPKSISYKEKKRMFIEEYILNRATAINQLAIDAIAIVDEAICVYNRIEDEFHE